MKRWLIVMLAVLLCAAAAAALAGDEYSPGYLFEPPAEVLDHIASRWPSWQLEDYCEVDGGVQGCYGFALLRDDARRQLIGYRREHGAMAYWLRNAGAVPQGREEAWFEVFDGEREPGFAVIRLDDAAESYEEQVIYRLKEEGFRLTGYVTGTIDGVVIRDGYLEFHNYAYPRLEGRVEGGVQTELRYVSFSALPKTLREGQESVTTAPYLPDGVFSPQQVHFTGGRKYEVYTGPGREYARSGNGKGLVSTNDWIQVFGEYDGYILIQYDISADQYRIGWIEASALPKGTSVAQLEFPAIHDAYRQDVRIACALTDDPFNSRKPICHLPQGHALTELVYDYEGWSYVRVEVDGTVYMGFVPSDCISHG